MKKKKEHLKTCTLHQFFTQIISDPVENFEKLAKKYNWKIDGYCKTLGYNKSCSNIQRFRQYGIYGGEDMPGRLGKKFFTEIFENKGEAKKLKTTEEKIKDFKRIDKTEKKSVWRSVSDLSSDNLSDIPKKKIVRYSEE